MQSQQRQRAHGWGKKGSLEWAFLALLNAGIKVHKVQQPRGQTGSRGDGKGLLAQPAVQLGNFLLQGTEEAHSLPQVPKGTGEILGIIWPSC